jgi:hypothetical protein
VSAGGGQVSLRNSARCALQPSTHAHTSAQWHEPKGSTHVYHVLQETLAGLRHELDVLAHTPVGALGRMLVCAESCRLSRQNHQPAPSHMLC